MAKKTDETLLRHHLLWGVLAVLRHTCWLRLSVRAFCSEGIFIHVPFILKNSIKCQKSSCFQKILIGCVHSCSSVSYLDWECGWLWPPKEGLCHWRKRVSCAYAPCCFWRCPLSPSWLVWWLGCLFWVVVWVSSYLLWLRICCCNTDNFHVTVSPARW